MGHRKKKPEEHSHAESWLVSYCDMISLLVTFFLMMLTFSTKSADDIREVGLQLLGGGGGVMEGRTMPFGEHLDREAVAGFAEQLAQFLDQRGVDEAASIRRVKDGFSIGFDVDSSFAPGSAVPTAPLVANLRELAPILARWTQLVIVDGYVEGDFQPVAGGYADAESLGLARASAAADILLGASQLSPAKLQIASAGTSYPRANESTPEGRASNQRVEIRVVSLAAPKKLARKEA
jgi:chemotaxis protein MotB